MLTLIVPFDIQVDSMLNLGCKSGSYGRTTQTNIMWVLLLQHVRNFSVKFRESVQLISVDDKVIVHVGEHNCPISTGVRGQNHSLVCSGSQLDNDFELYLALPLSWTSQKMCLIHSSGEAHLLLITTRLHSPQVHSGIVQKVQLRFVLTIVKMVLLLQSQYLWLIAMGAPTIKWLLVLCKFLT